MKYLAIDCETTGLDHESDDLLEIGIVSEDTDKAINDLDYCLIRVKKERYTGQPYALWLNRDLIKEIVDEKEYSNNGRITCYYSRPGEVVHSLKEFFKEWKLDKEITVAGKNFSGFDRNFLLQIPGIRSRGAELLIDDYRIRHRVIDPAVLYFNPRTDDHLPSLKECLIRANVISGAEHTALGDNLAVISLIRRFYGFSFNKNPVS